MLAVSSCPLMGKAAIRLYSLGIGFASIRGRTERERTKNAWIVEVRSG